MATKGNNEQKEAYKCPRRHIYTHVANTNLDKQLERACVKGFLKRRSVIFYGVHLLSPH